MSVAYRLDSTPELEDRLASLGLARNVRDLAEEGYTVVRDPKGRAIADALRAAIRRAVPEAPETMPGLASSRFTLLDADPVIAEAVTVPSVLALVELVLGRGALLSQVAASRRAQGAPAMGLHADNSWFPAPYPDWEIMCTACFVTDEFTEEAGATLVVPGTHRMKAPPPKGERAEDARPIVAEKGAICLWTGSVWHGNYPRSLPGERVVLHTTYTRLGMQPIETYDHLGADWFADKDPALPMLLGRENFLGRRHGWKEDHRPLLAKTWAQVHGEDNLPL